MNPGDIEKLIDTTLNTFRRTRPEWQGEQLGLNLTSKHKATVNGVRCRAGKAYADGRQKKKCPRK